MTGALPGLPCLCSPAQPCLLPCILLIVVIICSFCAIAQHVRPPTEVAQGVLKRGGRGPESEGAKE